MSVGKMVTCFHWTGTKEMFGYTARDWIGVCIAQMLVECGLLSEQIRPHARRNDATKKSLVAFEDEKNCAWVEFLC